jgi:hypothetical protein
MFGKSWGDVAFTLARQRGLDVVEALDSLTSFLCAVGFVTRRFLHYFNDMSGSYEAVYRRIASERTRPQSLL